MLLFLSVAFAWAAGLNAPAGWAQQQAAATDTSPVQLDFAEEIELRALVDFVSQRLGINFLYDDQIAESTLTIRAPSEIPANSLINLLESALKMKGFILLDAEVPGWRQIVKSEQMAANSAAADESWQPARFGGADAVTRVFILRHADAVQADRAVKLFLTAAGANSVAITEPPTLIVTDYAQNVLKIARLVELIDRSTPDVVVELLQIQRADASQLATQLNELLVSTTTGRSRRNEDPVLNVAHDPRTNQLMFAGQRTQVDQAIKLARALDVSLQLTTVAYQFEYVSADRIDRLAQNLLDPEQRGRLYKSAIDRDGNMLFVTATPEIHKEIERLKTTVDVESARGQSRIRFYKIENVTALDVLETIRLLHGQPLPLEPASGESGRIRGVRGLPQVPIQNRPPRYPSEPELPVPGGVQGASFNQPAEPLEPSAPPPVAEAPVPPPRSAAIANGAGSDVASDLLAGAELARAQVSADESSNTIIVVADPDVQRVYAELIRTLDRRRPQVLVDVKLVVIDTSDSFSLGVELSGGDRTGSRRLFQFSSYGLSEVDRFTGALALIPGTGFNWTLVDPEVADAVIRALVTHRRARVLSAPRILVNDNATGTLTSVSEVPFTSVNASQTVATTSFAGFAEAGTTVNVTPHISDGDHLQLEYRITVNSFTGSAETGSDGVPPPRQTDEVESEITIPDGHTVIVGGLNRSVRASDRDSLPLLGNMPVIGDLVSNQLHSRQCSSLFVFIRPIILRDDKFHDLKVLSKRDVSTAKIPPQYPRSKPRIMR